MSRAVKSRLQKLEKAGRKEQIVLVPWSGFGPEPVLPTLEPDDPRTFVVVVTGVPRHKEFRGWREDPE